MFKPGNRLRQSLASIWRKLFRNFGFSRIHDFPRAAFSPTRFFKRLVRKVFRPASPTLRSAYLPDKMNRGTIAWRDCANPWSWLRWLGGFFLAWLGSRPYASMLGAVPAIACGGVLASVVVFSGNRDMSKASANYREVFDAAIRTEDYSTAFVAIGTLVDSSPDNLDLRYQQAFVQHLRGNATDATHQMETLAVDRKYGKAAMWLISTSCNLQSLSQWSQAEHVRFRELIEIGLNNLEKENLLSAKVLIFSYLAEIGALGEASRYLADVVPERPELSLAAATLCRTQYDTEGTAKYALIGQRHFESQLSRHPNDINLRINLARILMIQQQFEAAAKLLNDGYRLTKDQRLTTVAGEALVVWADHLGQHDRDSNYLLKRLQILNAAIKLSPQDFAVSQAIMQLLCECRQSTLSKVVLLREEILNGTDAVSTEFIRGTLALLDGKFDQAKLHLELATQQQPGIPAVLNNLAVAISSSADGDLDQALALANAAVDKIPQQPYFLETRGQILLRLHRPQDAILDLEVALMAEELRPAIYPSLAQAYEQIGASDMTKMYRELASRSP